MTYMNYTQQSLFTMSSASSQQQPTAAQPQIKAKNPKDILLDSWVAVGNDFQKLYEQTKVMDSITKQIDFKTSQIDIITVNTVNKETGELYGYVQDGRNPKVFAIKEDDLIKAHGGTPELISETLREGEKPEKDANKNNKKLKKGNQAKMLFRIHNSETNEDNIFFVSERILKTLSQRAGCPIGHAALIEDLHMRFYRDAMYAAYMHTVPSQCHLIFREVDGAKKVYAVLSGRHAGIPQTESIQEVVKIFDDEFGKPDLKWWRVSNRETVLYVEYPDMAKDFTNVQKDNGNVCLPDEVIPGIYVRTADTGDSSFKVIATMKIGHVTTFVPESTFMRTHTKNVTQEEIIEKVKLQVFPEYARIPNRLSELLAIDIADPAKTVERVMKSCNIGKVLGDETERKAKESILGSLNPNLNYTAYEIAMLFMEESDRAEKDPQKDRSRDDALAKTRGCFVQALFYKYEDE